MGKLDNRVAFITGGAMGNGEGVARVFAGYGATVVLADISDQVFATAGDLQSRGFDALGLQLDVRHFDEVQKGVDEVLEKYRRIDILVNNAGVIRLANFLDMSDQVRDFHFDVNIKGAWNCTRAILPSMIRQDYGKIVIMSSVTGPMVADEGETAYATTKAALWGFTKALAREVARHRITVNAICPGYIMTPMALDIARQSDPGNPGAVIDGIAGAVPLGRLGTIEEVGELAAFLASEESTYITGAQVVIDGGSTLPETISVGA